MSAPPPTPPEDGAPVPAARRAPVMHDVARRAGVSHQTVSRVLNDAPGIRPVTRAKVQRAIDELGYRRNRSARALVTRRTLTVGVLASSTTLFGPASTLHGVERAAHAAGYATSLATCESPARAQTLAALEQLLDRGCDGVVVVAPLHEVPDLRSLLPSGLPAVTAAGGPVEGVGSVHVDHRGGARAATEHLLALGHREVRHVAGAEHWVETAERRGGWEDALRSAGVRPAPPLPGGWSPADGHTAGMTLDEAATAVVAANDQVALGLLRALHERGVEVPGRVSVVGFDDTVEAAYLAPPLTTVRQDLAGVGRRSVDLLLDQVAGAAGTHVPRVVVPAELVVRSSTGRPPTWR